MGIFDRFPYSSTHEMNLDFMLGKATEIAESLQEVQDGLSDIDTHKAQAEQAAQAAQASQAAASASAGQAAQHVTDAEDAADRAETASTEAETAADRAETALGNITNAETVCTEAAEEAQQYAEASQTHSGQAQIYKNAAEAAKNSAELNASQAATSAGSAANSATDAASSASSANVSATNANLHASNAETSATNAATSATNAATSATNAAASANGIQEAADHVESLVESLPEDFTDLNNTVNQLSDEIDHVNNTLIDSQLANPTKVENYYPRYADGELVSNSSYSYMQASGIGVYKELHVKTNNPKGITAICFYDANGNWISSLKTTGESSPYEYDAVITVPNGADMIRVSCLKEYLSNASLNTTLKVFLAGVNAEIDETNSSILDLKNENGDKFIPDDKWESGGVNYESGALVPTSSYIRTLIINIDEYYRITIAVDNGYKYTYAFYDSTGTNCVKVAGALLTESISVDKPTSAKYIRIALGKVSGNPDLSESTHVHALGQRKLLFDVANISVSVSTGTGNTTYDGEKIILDDSMPQKYRCNISAWKDFFKSDIANLADYSLHLNQSLAIYGGYMFLFQDGGEVVAIDYSTKSILGKFDTPVMGSNHQNGAHFSNIFYASGDEFPLLFVSRADTMPNNECLIYRVQRTGNVFSFSTVNTLNTSTAIYQGTYAIDNKRRIISCVSFLSANYGTATNNPVMIRTWNLPTKAEILSGNPISLDINDAFVEWSLPYAAFQQCALSNGVLFVGYQPEGGRNIYCFDALTGRFTSNVPMTDKVSEIEGVYVYDSKLFVTQKRGTDTTATNPLTIYEIVF